MRRGGDYAQNCVHIFFAAFAREHQVDVVASAAEILEGGNQILHAVFVGERSAVKETDRIMKRLWRKTEIVKVHRDRIVDRIETSLCDPRHSLLEVF